MTALQTDRLLIRNFRADDWRALRDLVIRYQASEYARYDHRWPTAEAEIEAIAASFAGDDEHFAVCLKDGGALIGLIALARVAEASEKLSLGYVFHADYQGQSLATEACRAIIDHAFDAGRAERVVANTAAVNTPSRALLRRLGMRETRRARAALQFADDGTPIEFLGISFAITREQWCAQRSTRSR